MVTKKELKKIYVLDTSVILFDHDVIRNFKEHDVALPITVLEELDHFKVGNDTINYQAREFIRFIDKLSKENILTDWLNINGPEFGRFKVIMHGKPIKDAEIVFDEKKADHRILNAALSIKEEEPGYKVILVTKDINLRLKAKSLNLFAEDYETGKIKNLDKLYTGNSKILKIKESVMEQLFSHGFVPYKLITKEMPLANHYFILQNDKKSLLAYFNKKSGLIKRIDKISAHGIKPRNAEQVFAMDAVLNPEISLVTIQGVAGTGKTLIALAAALEQKSNYVQIFLARPIVALGNKDIGYLPGDIKSKINPYMEPLWDNLKFIQSQWKERDKEFHRITDMVNSEKIVVTPLAYIRGRSLSNIIFIVDDNTSVIIDINI